MTWTWEEEKNAAWRKTIPLHWDRCGLDRAHWGRCHTTACVLAPDHFGPCDQRAPWWMLALTWPARRRASRRRQQRTA